MIPTKNIIILLCFLLSLAVLSCEKEAEPILEFSDESLQKYEERLLKYYYITEIGAPKIVEDGILFTFADDHEHRSVELSGDFLDWRITIPLIKGRYGVYYYLYQEPIKAGHHAYRYRVDDLWINDPLQTNKLFDAQNQELSYFEVEKDILYYRANPLYNDDYTVTFFYKDADATEVNFALNKDGFDSYRYPMQKDEDDIWSITLDLEPGPHYYNFVVDGQWIIDPVNYNIVRSDKNIEHSFVTIR